jgi:hypothetical protein
MNSPVFCKCKNATAKVLKALQNLLTRNRFLTGKHVYNKLPFLKYSTSHIVFLYRKTSLF